MGGKILVDTSAWVLSFRTAGNPDLKDYLRDALDADSVVTTDIVLLELLQGCKSKKEYDALKSRLDILPCFSLAERTWTLACESGFSLRRKGITVTTIDVMICSVAKENNLALLHHDSHLKVVSREMSIKSVDFMKA